MRVSQNEPAKSLTGLESVPWALRIEVDRTRDFHAKIRE